MKETTVASVITILIIIITFIGTNIILNSKYEIQVVENKRLEAELDKCNLFIQDI